VLCACHKRKRAFIVALRLFFWQSCWGEGELVCLWFFQGNLLVVIVSLAAAAYFVYYEVMSQLPCDNLNFMTLYSNYNYSTDKIIKGLKFSSLTNHKSFLII